MFLLAESMDCFWSRIKRSSIFSSRAIAREVSALVREGRLGGDRLRSVSVFEILVLGSVSAWASAYFEVCLFDWRRRRTSFSNSLSSAEVS